MICVVVDLQEDSNAARIFAIGHVGGVGRMAERMRT